MVKWCISNFCMPFEQLSICVWICDKSKSDTINDTHTVCPQMFPCLFPAPYLYIIWTECDGNMGSTTATHLGPVWISEKTSFRKISSSLEAARFVFRIVRSLWNLTGTSAAVLPMCLSNFKTIRQFKVPISWLRVFTRSCEKTSFRILRRGPGSDPKLTQRSVCKVWSMQLTSLGYYLLHIKLFCVDAKKCFHNSWRS